MSRARSDDRQVHHVALNDLDVAYRDVGSGDVVVCVHGITGSMRNWALIAPALASRFRVVSFDQRGHGLTSSPSPAEAYSLAVLSDDLRCLVQHLEIDQFTLVGHSMGSMVAQTFALANPSLVERLVLVGSTAGPIDDEERAILSEASAAAQRDGIEAAWELHRRLWPAWQEAMLGADPALLDRARQEFIRTSADGYAGFARCAIEREDLRTHLHEIACPTLVVVGEHDHRRLPTSRTIAQRISGAHHVVVPAAAHTPQIEAPDAFLESVLSFLDG